MLSSHQHNFVPVETIHTSSPRLMLTTIRLQEGDANASLDRM